MRYLWVGYDQTALRSVVGFHIAKFPLFLPDRETSRPRQRYNFGSRLADATSLCNPLVHEILRQPCDTAPDASARTSLRPPLRRSPAMQWPTGESRRLASRRRVLANALRPATIRAPSSPWRACSGSTLHYIPEAHQLLAIHAALPLASTRSYAAASLKPLVLRHSCVVTCLCTTAARSRPMNFVGHSSVPRSPTSSKAAILTYSTFDCSDAAHTMPLTSSLISRRFSSSTFTTHTRRPSACTRPNRSRAIRFGRHETLPRISHSPRQALG